jgi:hypothetical protein
LGGGGGGEIAQWGVGDIFAGVARSIEY